MKSILGILLLALLTSCTSKYGIRNAKAYVRETVAGTVKVDDDGRPLGSGISEERLIFIEADTSKPLPQITAAWVNQKPFAVRLVELNKTQLNVGKTKDGEEVILTAKDGHQLWQLLLLPQKTELSANDSTLQEKIQQNSVVLVGKWKEKEFTYAIPKEERLSTVFYQ